MARLKLLRSIFVDMHTLQHTNEKLFPYRLQGFRKEAFATDKRRLYPGIEALSLDEWDDTSLHIMCVDGIRIVGASRIVKEDGGNLPFNILTPSEGDSLTSRASPGDTELSRYIVSPQYRSGLIMRALLVGTVDGYMQNSVDFKFSGNIWTDVLLGGPRMLNRNTYFKLGFVETGIQMFDEAYNQISDIFLLDKADRHVFFEAVEKFRHRHVAGSKRLK